MVKKVLIVKTSSMGDIIHTLPALTDARKAIPTIQFDWVVEENFNQIPSWHPSVDNVITVAIRRWRKHWFAEEIRRERLNFYRALSKENYDVVIDAQGLLKSAILIVRKANGVKHGYDRRSVREKIACWFYDVRHAVSKNQHAVERIRQLFALSLNYQYDSTGDYGIARQFTSCKEGSYLIFIHATTRNNKHWPQAYWRQLIAEVGKLGLKIKLPWGTQAELTKACHLAKGFPHVEVMTRLSLVDMAAVLAGARGAVSVDTGLSHLMAALGKPNITLYGPTHPIHVGGYGRHQVALKSMDNRMASIKPSDVLALLKARQFL